MVQYKKCYELKNKAKDALEGKYGGAMLIIFLCNAITWMVRMSISIVGDNTAAGIYGKTQSQAAAIAVIVLFKVVLLLATVIAHVMNAGITLYFLKLACGQPLTLGDLFCGYRSESKKALLLAGAMVLCHTVCLGPSEYFAQQLLLGMGSAAWYAFIALAIGLCAYLPLSLGIALSFYLMLDFPQKSGKETLLLCWRLMKGKRLRLLYLKLSFFPLMLLCLLTFGIGLLWLYPYRQMTYTLFFLDLMNPCETSSQAGATPCGPQNS